ncbi:MAG TPA: DJ-1 family glyoxalase III [Bdellovibrionota bacterium]|nr:DJ-1 family glyoxalase III [Bdellovibrionota bacterium]
MALRNNPRVLIPLAEGFEEIEAVTIIDLLRRAGVEVIMAGLAPRKTVKGAHSIGFETETSLRDVEGQDFEAIILPGGMPGSTNLAESKELEGLLRKHQTKGSHLAAICAAPTVLAKYGFLKGKRATCYPSFEAKLGGSTISKESVVEDGNIVTSRGPGTAIPFALAMIRRLVGPERAEEVRKNILS